MLNQIGDTLHGFTVTRIRSSEELGGRMVEMCYEKTGTPLVWIDNHLDNKLFSISFKTLPSDSTGVFHILEHSVLCGSERYPVREPFVELLKSSMNTFLNAMTFPDKTMYPVSSRNDRDFLNLTSVYLDAVFAPNILTNPSIFYQEGWHIDEDGESDEKCYKGVVFNEMKGAMGSVEELMSYRMLSLLFPDSCYGYNSGGDPAVIPTLTYEQFTETYRRFYHPSNAYIFLDGEVPLDETLGMIAEYLSRFEKSDDLPQIAVQTPVSVSDTQYYELDKEEPETDKTNLSFGKILCTWEDRVKQLAFLVLKDAVAGSNETPLKRAVLSAGIAQEMYISLETSVAQPYIETVLRNVADGKADNALPLIRQTVRELLAKGLDRDALHASANRLEFHMLEPDEPQGLDRCITAMQSWLYGGDPMQQIVYHDDFIKVRDMIENGGMEQLLGEVFLKEEGTAVLRMLPSYTRGDELRQAEEARLRATVSAWTEQQRQANRTLNQTLKDWQMTPDTPEQLATLPVLPLSAVSGQPAWTESIAHQTDGVTVLYHPAPCKGIVHISLYFALTDCTLAELSDLVNVTMMFGKLDTANYTALALQQKLKNTLGRLTTGVEAYAHPDHPEVCTPVFGVQCSVLEEKLPEAFDLIMEVLQTTDFTQKEKIREILLQADERAKQAAVSAGHVIAMGCVMSHYTARDAVRSALHGYPAIMRLHELVQQFDAQFDAVSALFRRVQTETVCKKRMTLASVTAAADADITALIQRFPEGTAVPADAAYSGSLPAHIGLPIPAQIGFAVQGCHAARMGMQFDAGWRVAAKLISLGYLWNTVRVQGGAYGTGLSVQRDGTLFTYSFRDPSPARSLAVNAEIAAYIRAFCESGEQLDKYIISTVSDEDPLRSPRENGIFADALWRIGRTREMLTEERRQMLQTTRESLLASCEVWERFAADGATCVCAAENLLDQCEGLTRMSLSLSASDE